MKILAIRRAEQFSPNNVDNDAAILKAVTDRLETDGYLVKTISETKLSCLDGLNISEKNKADVYISMGRLNTTIQMLKAEEDMGALVINSGYGVEACTRSLLQKTMRKNHIPSAPLKSSTGYWLKRGDTAAQSKDDILFVNKESEIESARRHFYARGIKDVVISPNVQGDLIKFYGVKDTDFFRLYYPTDDGVSKFGDEKRNGIAQHYIFKADNLREVAHRLACVVDIDVYGGDCIVGSDGKLCIIDFNDWPSFSRCRQEAADAISIHICEQINKFEIEKKETKYEQL